MAHEVLLMLIWPSKLFYCTRRACWLSALLLIILQKSLLFIHLNLLILSRAHIFFVSNHLSFFEKLRCLLKQRFRPINEHKLLVVKNSIWLKVLLRMEALNFRRIQNVILDVENTKTSQIPNLAFALPISTISRHLLIEILQSYDLVLLLYENQRRVLYTFSALQSSLL